MAIDITERKETEKALRESEERYRVLIENQAEGIGIVDAEERFIFANPSAHDIFGVPLGGLVGRNLREFTHEDNFSIIRAQTELRKLGKKTSYEFEIIRPDGERRIIFVISTPRLDNEGRFVGALGVFSDITERKKMEKIQASIYRISKEAHSAENLDKLFRLIHETIGELMPAKNFFIALYDVVAETMSFPYFVDEYDKPPAPRKLGKGLTEYVLRTGEPLLASPKVFDELVKKGKVEVIGHPAIDWLGAPLKTKDRTIGVLAIQSYTESVRISEEDKDMLMFVSTQIAMAIERKRAEIEIKTRQKYLESVLSNAPNAIVTLDAFCRILDWNPGAERLFGYTRGEVLGKNIDELLTRPDVKDEAIALTKQVLSEGRVLPLETVRYRKDKTPVNVIVAGSTIQVGEEMQGVAAVYTDITEQKKTEGALKQAKAKLEEWNLQLENKMREAQKKLLCSERLATIGRLAASLGHELRNPLGVLHNSLYLLNHKLKDADEMVKKQLTIMEREVRRSDKIIRDLLDFSRKREPSFVPTDLNGVVEEVLSKVEVPEGVKVVKELDSLQSIIADGTQLQSVFLNLITNGIQAMPEGGTLGVKTSKNNRFVEVRISDTGCGIPKENLENIFEPLFSTKSKGIGLGLSVTRRFVENHGGRIEVKSRLGKGTTFVIRLPVQQSLSK